MCEARYAARHAAALGRRSGPPRDHVRPVAAGGRSEVVRAERRGLPPTWDFAVWRAQTWAAAMTASDVRRSTDDVGRKALIVARMKPEEQPKPPGRGNLPKSVAKLPQQVREELTRRLRRNKRAFREED